MVNSCHKGKRGAVAIAKIFKDAFKESAFERTKDGVPGPDIRVPDWFGYAIEAKDDNKVKAIHLWKPTALLKQYWTQAELQADSLDLLPLLCIKIDRHWFAIPEWGAWQLLDDWIKDYKEMHHERTIAE